MQCDLFAFGAHQMIDDVAGRRVAASVAEPLLVLIAHEHRGRVVYATVGARMRRQVDYVVHLLLIAVFEVQRVELFNHLAHTIGHSNIVAARPRCCTATATETGLRSAHIGIELREVRLLRARDRLLIRKRQLVVILSRLRVVSTHEIAVYKRQRLGTRVHLSVRATATTCCPIRFLHVYSSNTF